MDVRWTDRDHAASGSCHFGYSSNSDVKHPVSRVSVALSSERAPSGTFTRVLTGEIGYRSFRRHLLQRSGEMCDTTEITAAS